MESFCSDWSGKFRLKWITQSHAVPNNFSIVASHEIQHICRFVNMKSFRLLKLTHFSVFESNIDWFNHVMMFIPSNKIVLKNILERIAFFAFRVKWKQFLIFSNLETSTMGDNDCEQLACCALLCLISHYWPRFSTFQKVFSKYFQ